jgi:hypothetical protein
MERTFGADFRSVRVHTDTIADALNRVVQAHAFTTGQDIFFRHGEYNPGSVVGQKVIAHELTHVVQQQSDARSSSAKDPMCGTAFVIQRITERTYRALYAPHQPEYPALRFHKNKDWRRLLDEKGEFQGDAYGLRDPDYDPLLRHPLGRYTLENRRAQSHREGSKFALPSDFGLLTGYNATLSATVERAVHRTITEHLESLALPPVLGMQKPSVSQPKTVTDLLDAIDNAGPLLIVNVGGPAGYERYYSPDYTHFSFGKVGKRAYISAEVLGEIPLITRAVRAKLRKIATTALSNAIVPAVRNAIIPTAIDAVDRFLTTRYGDPTYWVPPSFDENAPEVRSILEELEAEIASDARPSYLDL